MNFIDFKFNEKKLQENILSYCENNNQYNPLIFRENCTVEGMPVLLMNSDTLNFLSKKSFSSEKENIITKFFGCNIAIANWLPFGEVDIK